MSRRGKTNRHTPTAPTDDTKACARCGQRFTYDHFHKNRANSDGHNYWCKPCVRTATARAKRERRLRDPTYYADEGLRRRYGMTVKEREDMIRAQGGKCAICGGAGDHGRRRRLHVDHCHASGRVRGLLCHRCNVGIGYFQEDTERLRGAIRYLETAP